MTFRTNEVYVQPEIFRALHTIKREGETIELLVERYLIECLKRDWPGIFDILSECGDEIDKAKAANKTRLDNWMKALPTKGMTLP